MKFFYNPEPFSPLTEKEQEDYYCTLRDSTKKRINISLTKRVYSIQIVVGELVTKYTVGENASAIFESEEWINPHSYFIFSGGTGFLLEPNNNSHVIVEYFEL